MLDNQIVAFVIGGEKGEQQVEHEEEIDRVVPQVPHYVGLDYETDFERQEYHDIENEASVGQIPDSLEIALDVQQTPGVGTRPLNNHEILGHGGAQTLLFCLLSEF